VKNTLTPQGLQELVNMTRSIADIQRFFPYNARTALVARGTPEQIALAGWLIQSFDRPVSEPVHEYRMPDTANTIVRFTYLANAQMPPNDLQGMVNVVRTETGIQRIYPSQYRKAVAMRGTADQISRADQLIRERDK
jgi:hypothetical protein